MIPRRPIILIGVLLAVLLFRPQYALAETRIALVIGNGLCESAPLDSPPRDADLMAETLRSLNFEVTVGKNVNQKMMQTLIRDFGRRLKRASSAVGFFYYSGHGMQVKGRNYMIPVDANIEDESDVRIDGVEANSVLVRMELAKAKINIVVLDACRNNPFEKRFKGPGEGTGLAVMEAPAGTLIAYATAPGDVASPGPKGGLSPLTKILASTLHSSHASLLTLFNDVSTVVYKQSGYEQRPYIESSVVPPFTFQAQQKVRLRPPTLSSSNALTVGNLRGTWDFNKNESDIPPDFTDATLIIDLSTISFIGKENGTITERIILSYSIFDKNTIKVINKENGDVSSQHVILTNNGNRLSISGADMEGELIFRRC